MAHVPNPQCKLHTSGEKNKVSPWPRWWDEGSKSSSSITLVYSIPKSSQSVSPPLLACFFKTAYIIFCQYNRMWTCANPPLDFFFFRACLWECFDFGKQRYKSFPTSVLDLGHIEVYGFGRTPTSYIDTRTRLLSHFPKHSADWTRPRRPSRGQRSNWSPVITT